MRRVLRSLVPPQLVRYRHGGAKRGVIALTFDDGPVRGCTEQFALGLRQQGHAATFFIEGQKAESCVDILRVIQECGSEIGNHSYSHEWWSRLSHEQIAAEVDRTDAIIQTAQPDTTPRVRPPYGEISWPVLRFMMSRRRGVVLWTHVVGNYGGRGNPMVKTADQVVEEFCALPIRSGDIILMHDWCVSTLEALPRILSYLETKQLCSITLADLCASEPGRRV
jgi:peptidoglycan/xylan/chitin deacetylase (PgdA/CDA1 family)